MASKKHTPAKVLDKDQQKFSIKGLKKQKTVVKTTLENPFTLDWPIIGEESEKEIASQLESCCHDLKIPICKPPWEELLKLRGKERKTYCQEYKKTFLKKLFADPVAVSKYELAKEARSHLIFGYNAVMRALEQNSLAGILVKKDVQPAFLVKTFLPGCVYKCVPLIPVNGLDYILKSEDTLAVQHNVMVLGLKLSVKELSCRFYPLYVKMTKACEGLDKVLEAFEIEQNTGTSEMLVSSNKENSDQNTESHVENKENSKQNIEISENLVNINIENNHKEQDIKITNYKLSQEQIQSYHLKRTNKCERVFIPRSTKAKTVDNEEDIIYIQPMKGETLVKEKLKASGMTFTVKKEEKAPILEPKGFSFEFFLDTTGNEDGVKNENTGSSDEEITGKKKKQRLNGKDVKDGKRNGKGDKEEKTKKKISENMNRPYISSKTKRIKNNPYISAKTKRIKSNPNRKEMKKMNG